MPPQAQAQPQEQGSYTFVTGDGQPLSVKGLKVRSSSNPLPHYASQSEALDYLRANGFREVMTPEERTQQTPTMSTIPGAMAKRASSTLQSLLPADSLSDIHEPDVMLARSGLNPAAIVTSLAQAEGKLGKRVGQQAKARDPRALFTLLGMNPFSAQTIADMGEQVDKGDTAGARGTGIVDALLLAGASRPKVFKTIGELRRPVANYRTLGPSAAEASVDSIARATGAEQYKHGQEIRDTAPALSKAAKADRPKNIQALRDLFTEVKRNANNKFNMLIAPIRRQQVIPSQIATELGNLANSPALTEKAAAGDRESIATIRYLNNEVIKWSRPYTLEALNEMRSTESAKRASSYDKSIERQGAQLRGDIIKRADAIEEAGLRDVVYSTLERAYPHEDIRGLKKQQSQLITLESDMTDRVKSLESAQMSQRGRLMREKVTLSGYGHPERGNVGTSVHGLQHMLPSGFSGPEATANAAVRKAFPSRTKVAARVAGRTLGRVVPVAPKERDRSLAAQLKVAERINNKAWAERVRKAQQKAKEAASSEEEE